MGWVKELKLRNGQLWRLSSTPGPPPGTEKWGACVLASLAEMPPSAGDLAAQAAAEGRCPAIGVVAPNSEAVHDHIDEIVERHGALHVRTAFTRGPEALSEMLSLLDSGLAGPGPVYVFSDPLSYVEAGLRDEGLLS